MSNNIEQTTTFTLHYDGEHIVNHKMNLDSFITSVNGFNNLIKYIGEELGISSKDIVLEILPIEQGGIKAKIVFTVVGFAAGAICSNLFDHALNDLHVYERLGVAQVVYRMNQFLDRKKSVSDYKNINQLTANLDVQATHIMLNRQIHGAAEQFTSVLGCSADKLDLSSTINTSSIQLVKSDFPKFKNPFIEQDIDERVYEEEKILRLEGPRYSGNEWIFYEKDAQGKWNKENSLRAIVLDDFLLSFGRENSLQDLKDKDLYCKVRYKEIMKPGNKKKTIEKYIIQCRLEPNGLF